MQFKMLLMQKPLKQLQNFLYNNMDKLKSAPKGVLRENITIVHTDKDGVIKDTRRISNLVPSAGLAGIASRINGSGAEAAFTYLAIGIGTVDPDPADTTLGSEITTNGGERDAGTGAAAVSRTTTNVANDTATLIKTWTFTGSFAVTETGAFNSDTAGTMLNRSKFTAINVVSTDQMQVTVDLAFANA